MKKGRFALYITGFLAAVIILVAGTYMFMQKDALPRAELAADQRKVVDEFGYPDVFVLMMENTGRSEIWTYFDCGMNCVFKNGKLQEYKYQAPLTDKFHWPELKPDQFPNGITEQGIRHVLGEPSAVAEADISIAEGVRIYDYFDQVKVGMVKGRVVYVQTLPIALE